MTSYISWLEPILAFPATRGLGPKGTNSVGSVAICNSCKLPPSASGQGKTRLLSWGSIPRSGGMCTWVWAWPQHSAWILPHRKASNIPAISHKSAKHLTLWGHRFPQHVGCNMLLYFRDVCCLTDRKWLQTFTWHLWHCKLKYPYYLTHLGA